jgi:pantothenate kinase
MTPYTARDIRKAAEVLGINDQASLNEIRHRYHDLMKIWHPDVATADNLSALRTATLLNKSYEILVEYCMNHRLSFRFEDLMRSMEKSPSEYWMERFGDDPIWG